MWKWGHRPHTTTRAACCAAPLVMTASIAGEERDLCAWTLSSISRVAQPSHSKVSQKTRYKTSLIPFTHSKWAPMLLCSTSTTTRQLHSVPSHPCLRSLPLRVWKSSLIFLSFNQQKLLLVLTLYMQKEIEVVTVGAAAEIETIDFWKEQGTKRSQGEIKDERCRETTDAEIEFDDGAPPPSVLR